jgi:hypothetical protein
MCKDIGSMTEELSLVVRTHQSILIQAQPAFLVAPANAASASIRYLVHSYCDSMSLFFSFHDQEEMLPPQCKLSTCLLAWTSGQEAAEKTMP